MIVLETLKREVDPIESKLHKKDAALKNLLVKTIEEKEDHISDL